MELKSNFSWVLKEAAYKALPAHHLPQRLSWKSLDLRYLLNGAPTLHLVHPDAPGVTVVGGVQFMATISGDAGVVVGVVVASGRG